MTTRAQHYSALTALLLVATSWGATFVLTKAVLKSMTPEWFMFYRFSLAAILLLPLVMREKIDRAAIRMSVTLGVLVLAGYWLQTAGLQYTTPSRSAFLTGVGIVAVPLFDRLIYRTRLQSAALIGLALAIGGLFVLFGGFEGRLNVGDFMTIACAVAFSIHIVLTARYSELVSPTVLSVIQLAVVAIGALPMLPFSEHRPFNAFTIGALLYFAVVNTSIAFVLVMWGQKRVSATEAAIVLSFEPVAAAMTSVLFRMDEMTTGFIAGGTLVVTGIVVSQLQPGKVEQST